MLFHFQNCNTGCPTLSMWIPYLEIQLFSIYFNTKCFFPVLWCLVVWCLCFLKYLAVWPLDSKFGVSIVP